MKKNGYYSSGQFAKMAQVSVRTIRFYDQQNILKPSYVSESGSRFYTDEDLARLQQILLLKYLGFSLKEIKDLTVSDMDKTMLVNSLDLQRKLISDRIEQMQLVEHAIQNTITALKEDQSINWDQMLNLIHLTNMETSLKSQYQDATNISSRIRLHNLYSTNKEGWFQWIYRQIPITPGICILEIGCGDGTLWTHSLHQLPSDISIVLSDLSEGMIRDTRRNIGTEDSRFSFEQFDCHHIPYSADSFDVVIANHVLFYCEDIPAALREVSRVLKPKGTFLCSAYGPNHMQEISTLVSQFDNRIVLSAERLYEQFGIQNGTKLLEPNFSSIQFEAYEDSLLVTKAEDLIEYILSCHGNQNQYILERYKDFRTFVERKTQKGFSITKEAGVFLCKL
ncbi:MAG: methyltransferase domain-containing protein [Clostridiales bacterium]|nr:methyltransferase domain-containing protein [Clostridiales bacterium]